VTKAEFIRDAAEEIKRQRAALGLTRAEIATAVGVSENAVLYWEQGRNLMSAYAATLLRLYFKRKWAEQGQLAKAEQHRAARAEAAQ
jgi:DNA-binding transcriptional regulator YiaG